MIEGELVGEAYAWVQPLMQYFDHLTDVICQCLSVTLQHVSFVLVYFLAVLQVSLPRRLVLLVLVRVIVMMVAPVLVAMFMSMVTFMLVLLVLVYQIHVFSFLLELFHGVVRVVMRATEHEHCQVMCHIDGFFTPRLLPFRRGSVAGQVIANVFL